MIEHVWNNAEDEAPKLTSCWLLELMSFMWFQQACDDTSSMLFHIWGIFGESV